MKVAIALLSLISLTFAAPPDCGPMPAKKPTECCQNLDKLAKESIYEACKTECVKDRCCMGDCIGRGFGFIKDGKFDKDSALKSVNTAFAGNAEWIPIATKAVNDCATESASLTSPRGPPCASPENGAMTFCIKKKLYTNCPRPVTNDAECEKVKTFMNCVGM